MINWKKHRKKIISSSILGLLILALVYVYKRFPVITAYAAKDVCSCIFVAEREEQDVLDNELQFSFIKYANVTVDYENKSVTANLMGLGDKTAYYHPTKGCAILNKKQKKDFFKNSYALSPVVYSELPTLPDSLNTNYTAIQKVISEHFIDTDLKKPFGARAVVVLHKGKIIGEQYSEGFDRNSKQLGWSMTKSIFNALIGIAIQQKQIKGLDQNKLFSSWTDERSAISVKNLLQMTSGLNWKEDYTNLSGATIMLYNQDNMVAYASDQPLEATIGEHWEYSSGTSNLLSGLLRKVIDNDSIYLQYPYSQLFNKIGAGSFRLETDAADNFVASSYAWATARDWAKFGQLFLQDGNWNGEQILPTDWSKFTAEEANGSKGSYGAQFWLPLEKEYPNSPKDMYFADGFQGQRIFIIPSEELVIVRLGLTRFDQPNYDALVSEIVKLL
jgi:CubicO group peptidase (beta-lactamase class C family)